MKSKVVIGFIGTQLDAGTTSTRWEKWRPTLSIAQHEDLSIARFELIHGPQHAAIAKQVKEDIAASSPESEVRLISMHIRDPWDFGDVYRALYDWIRTYPFAPEREEYWTHITTGTHVAQICLFLLVESRFIPGVLLQTAPPKRHAVGKPGTYSLIDLDLSRYDAIAQRFAQEQDDAVSFLKSGIATRNSRFNALIEEIERVAVRSRAPMLLTGPTGAGKSFLARRMYELKKARHLVNGAFVEVNCATLQGDGAASALFGHKKGSFTGAASDRAGLLRSANGGLLFLDEIGELGLDEQAMLLKAIEEKRFYPVGSDKEIESDFQLIAGTNKDLRVEVRNGQFREDLYSRINLWNYLLPALAERPEDIEPNIEYMLTMSAQELGRQARFNFEAKKTYMRFATSKEALWSGNFRDLYASITRLATLAEGGRIAQPLVKAEIERLRWLWHRSQPSNDIQSNAELSILLDVKTEAELDLFDRLQLQSVVEVCRNARTLSEAGRALFNASREKRASANDADRLRKYLQRFGLDWAGITAS
jgi:transcriptional regulatory protein RtcR